MNWTRAAAPGAVEGGAMNAAGAHAAPPNESLFDATGRVREGWRTTFASMVGLTLGPSSVLVFCFGTFVPPLEREFGWGIGAISFGATLITAMIVLTSVLAGVLVDRIGVRRLVLCSMPLFGLGVAALALLRPEIQFFYAGLVLVALFGVGVWPVTYNKATAVWFDRHLGLSLGLANVGIGLGSALLPVLVSVIIAQHGWRSAYVALGALAVLIPWPICYWMLKERAAPGRAAATGMARTVDAVGAGSAPAAGMTFAEARATREFWLALAGFFTLGAVSSGVVIHQVRILIDTGMTMAQATAMQSVLGLALIAGRICTGWLLDRYPVSRVMSVLCLCATAALLLLAAGAPYHTAGLCAALVGFVIGAEFDVLGFLIPRYFGRRAFGVIYGTTYAVFQIAAGTAIGLLGWWRSTHGSYFAGLCVIALGLAAGAWLFSRLGAYRFPPVAHR